MKILENMIVQYRRKLKSIETNVFYPSDISIQSTFFFLDLARLQAISDVSLFLNLQ